MCRQNQLIGCAVLTLGLGVLVGSWLESAFLAHILGFGLLLTGLCIGRKK